MWPLMTEVCTVIMRERWHLRRQRISSRYPEAPIRQGLSETWIATDRALRTKAVSNKYRVSHHRAVCCEAWAKADVTSVDGTVASKAHC